MSPVPTIPQHLWSASNMLSGRLTVPSGTLLYPLKCRGPGTVGLELVARWGPRQEIRQKGR